MTDMSPLGIAKWASAELRKSSYTMSKAMIGRRSGVYNMQSIFLIFSCTEQKLACILEASNPSEKNLPSDNIFVERGIFGLDKVICRIDWGCGQQSCSASSRALKL